MTPYPNPLLVVLNPRDIPVCMRAIEGLRIAKLWLSYMNEVNAAHNFNRMVETFWSFSPIIVLSDDCAPTEPVLDLVYDAWVQHQGQAITGYCNLDATRPHVNLCSNRLHAPPPTMYSYRFLTRDEADNHPKALVPTTFAGLSLTCMSRDMWRRFPLEVSQMGGQMDYILSYRLAKAGIPIDAPRGAYVHHVKERWSLLDEDPAKRLLIGERKPHIRWGGL